MSVNVFDSSVLDSLPAHIVVLNAQGIIIAVNKAWRQFGIENGLSETSHSLLGANYLNTCKNFINQPDGDEANAAQEGITTVLAGEQAVFYLEYSCHTPNQQRWFSMNVSPLQDSHGGVVVSHENITERKLAEIALRASELRFRAIIDASPIPMTLNNAQGNITYLNRAFIQTIGYTLADIPTLADWWLRVYPESSYRQRVTDIWHSKLAEAIHSNKPFAPLERNITCKDGTVRIFMASISALDDNNFADTHLVTLYDITERKKTEESLYDLAYYDPLTHLPNRRLMRDRLKQALISRKLKSRYGAILFIDLNDFKTLNDTKGHDSGDLLLIEVSKLLQATVHEDDTVARTAGNEFVVLLDALDMSIELAATQAETIANRILTAIGQPFDLRGYEYRCSASIGIALFHSYAISVDELVKQADMAMHQAKKVGKNTLCFFDLAVQEALEFRVQLEVWMHKALNEQYELYYQLQIDDKGKAMGAETLIRWNHPEQGMISPVDFIPLAEETGLILQIGQWVLETACRQLKAWEHNQTTQHLVLAVNVSAKQFIQKDFVKQVLIVLKQTGANPHRLKLELTESMLVDNVENIIAKMNDLKFIGVKFSLDDFGTGFSSLSYLKRLPFNQLKIDQSFVRDALTDVNDAAIIRAVIALGQSLGMEVIAEGVETEAQRTFLLAHGCTHYQGYFFSKPLPLKQFEQLLRNKA